MLDCVLLLSLEVVEGLSVAVEVMTAVCEVMENRSAAFAKHCEFDGVARTWLKADMENDNQINNRSSD